MQLIENLENIITLALDEAAPLLTREKTSELYKYLYQRLVSVGFKYIGGFGSKFKDSYFFIEFLYEGNYDHIIRFTQTGILTYVADAKEEQINSFDLLLSDYTIQKSNITTKEDIDRALKDIFKELDGRE